MSQYWQNYWDKHVDNVSSDDPFRQVLRVQNKEPMPQDQFRQLANQIRSVLELSSTDSLIDLCCGNGLLTVELAPHCKEVTAIDFCEELVDAIPVTGPTPITTVVSDAVSVDLAANSADKILIAAALQHFSQGEVVQLLRKTFSWLRPGGRLLVTDILDSERIWAFYNSPERESAYFDNLAKQTPILGTWFHRTWLEKLGQDVGFAETQILVQPREQIYSHYRFDLLAQR